MREEKIGIPPLKWIEWFGSIVLALTCLVAFVYTTFQTKSDAKDQHVQIRESFTQSQDDIKSEIKSDNQHVEKRLDRIEGKLDSLLEGSK